MRKRFWYTQWSQPDGIATARVMNTESTATRKNPPYSNIQLVFSLTVSMR